ncbi:hypothetical protein DGWBC_0835 [Dehalogenimonas sp. WBC-2]|nr:hypothetical protein DGWBC_0835 [Dehalogenimonas sp. WBC-2]
MFFSKKQKQPKQPPFLRLKPVKTTGCFLKKQIIHILFLTTRYIENTC